ncbi:hypothetical protein EDD21DRAFT_140030 [Dissophora ornata]|nr:hypothetical protein EDD21DRAFT_140030 [Dissophora ornata]
MFHHVYPPWHKPVQRCLFVIAAVLCITLPVIYGKNHSISSKALGAILGVYFGLWLVCSLIIRFFVPSPHTESSLPVYTHSPIPTPVTLHSPTRPDALPSSPAIRLHSSTAAERPPAVVKGARFAELEDAQQESPLATPARAQRNVKFQTRPRGNTTDSTNSVAYPTFAAYRQAQHGNFDAFAQRVKRTFAISQQKQQEQQQLEEDLRRQQLEQQEQGQPIQDQQLRPSNTRTQSSSSVRILMPPIAAAAAPGIKNNPSSGSGTRSRSASAASMIGDIAERIKNGSFFRRSSIINPAADPAESTDGNRRSINKTREQSAEGLSGIEIMVTSSEDDHPLADANAEAETDTNQGEAVVAVVSNGTCSIPATEP